MTLTSLVDSYDVINHFGYRTQGQMGIPEEDVKVGLDAFLESLVFWNLSLAAKKTLEKGEKRRWFWS